MAIPWVSREEKEREKERDPKSPPPLIRAPSF
jgi:hypothetical protein